MVMQLLCLKKILENRVHLLAQVIQVQFYCKNEQSQFIIISTNEEERRQPFHLSKRVTVTWPNRSLWLHQRYSTTATLHARQNGDVIQLKSPCHWKRVTECEQQVNRASYRICLQQERSWRKRIKKLNNDEKFEFSISFHGHENLSMLNVQCW